MSPEENKDKQKFEDTKKTVEAHKTLSEEEAETKAEKVEETTEDMVKEEIKKEDIAEEAEKEKTSTPEPEKNVDQGREKRRRPGEKTEEELLEAWEPKTQLGLDVKSGKIKDIDEILDKKTKILEAEIISGLLKNLKSDLISIGQSKGKFGGGKRRAWRQTQRKTKAKNIPTFSTMAVVGDENGHVGVGTGRAMETLPARDKAIRKAKLNIIKVPRTCAGFDCACSELHTVPFKVTGKSGSVEVTLIPASQGTGLVVGNELKKVLQLAGIRDVYSRTSGRKRTTFNLIKACMEALKKTRETKTK